MSIDLEAIDFPLYGSRLIEASAGTGKTYTIAALYVRLVLGHGANDCRFMRPLQPSEILVMTFTRAATRELSDRIRARLVEAAMCFRGQAPDKNDEFLQKLIACYGEDQIAMQQAAHLLLTAAQSMDESAIFTIDAWCQRMLREHAFDSGALFDEELVENERSLFSHAVRDYWRAQVYALCDQDFSHVYEKWKNLETFEKAVRDLVGRSSLIAGTMPGQTLADAVKQWQTDIDKKLAGIKSGWATRSKLLQQWFNDNRPVLSGTTYKDPTVNSFFDALNQWAENSKQIEPGIGFHKAWDKWDAATISNALKKNQVFKSAPPEEFALIAELKSQLEGLPKVAHYILPHAAVTIAKRMQVLKAAARKFGFADLLTRLKAALEGENGAALRARILARYPVALIDEFQDTSPEQYSIFNMLYNVENANMDNGLFLIGDPKQAIYGFRGADIHSYLAARRATVGRHYRLKVNYRSTKAVVEAINQLFGHAEGSEDTPGHDKGAFRFRNKEDNPLPFERVTARDRKEKLMCGGEIVNPMTVWVGNVDDANNTTMQRQFAAACAEQIVMLLNDASVRFESKDEVKRLQPADIAVLVRDRFEAAAIQHALRQREVRSVYLSDNDSIFNCDETADVLRWLQAVSAPLDGRLARAAFATRTAGLSIAELVSYTEDDFAWEARLEQLKQLKQVWQNQGVLAMLRRFIHQLHLPSTLLAQSGGERSLTNLLHLAELLQAESQKLDGEQALIRWLSMQIDHSAEQAEEHVMRLESDAQLVKIITVHKSKGLEYPLVFLPFSASCRPVTGNKRSYFEYTDLETGQRKVDVTMSKSALEAAEKARIEEDLRLLYVALTRARHALWLGVPSLKDKIHLSAIGYLINGGKEIEPAELKGAIHTMCQACAHIVVEDLPSFEHKTILSREEQLPELKPVKAYDAQFECDWSVESFSSITRKLFRIHSPSSSAEQKALEEDTDLPATGPLQEHPWHQFPKGQAPGLFLHSLLEWMVEEGFEGVGQPSYQQHLGERFRHTPWEKYREGVTSWLSKAMQTPLPPFDASLCQLPQIHAEVEFWLPVASMPTARLDRLCRENLFPELARPAMSTQKVTGMLRGFIDLVFEHDGRYWILDYKSTTLGSTDDAYHISALQTAVVQHRYEVQGVIYLLALHRLLKNRLGEEYDPAQHLGGAVFFFLRGIGNRDTRGCCHISPDLALLEELDSLLAVPLLEEEV